MKALLNTITSIVLLTCCYTAYAEESSDENLRRYDVEVIIFEDTHARYLDSESWPVNNSDTASGNESDTAINKASSVRNEQTSTNNQEFTSIKPEILTRQYNSLKRSSEYTLLFRSAWRQTGLAKNEAFEIDIDDLTNTHTSRSKNTISGKLKIVLARYLHFYSDLEYQRHSEPASDTDSKKTDDSKTGESQTNEAEPVTENNLYVIQSHRRMRSKELHYIDHPLLGILIQINPVEVKTEPELTKSDSTT